MQKLLIVICAMVMAAAGTAKAALAAHWAMDDGSGTVLTDSTANGNNGALKNGAGFTTDRKFGPYALAFDGSNDYAEVGTPGVSISGNFSFTLWVKPNFGGQGVNFAALLGNLDGSPNGQGYSVEFSNANETGNERILRFWTGDGGWWAPVTAITPLGDGIWYHIAGTSDGATIKIYVNGVLEGTLARGALVDSTVSKKIGARPGLGRWFKGKMDDVAIWNEVLTEGDIDAIMNNGITGFMNMAKNPSPPDGATDVARDQILNWSNFVGGSENAVYFGTDEAAVTNADRTDVTGIYKGQYPGTAYDPFDAGDMGSLTTYYWRIDTVTAGGVIAAGDVWEFTTIWTPPLPAGPADLNEDGGVDLIDFSMFGQRWGTDNSTGIEAGYVYMPDTLDLQYRAQLAINAYTNTTNPNEAYLMYFIYSFAGLYRKPPVLGQPADISVLSGINAKSTQGLALCRMATRSDFNIAVDDTWKQTIHDIFASSSPSVTIGVNGGRLLATLTNYYLDDQDSTWLSYAQRMVDASIPQFVDEGSWGHYYGGPPPPVPAQGWDATFHGWILQGLADYYRVSGDATTGSIGNKVSYFLKDHAQVFDSSGHWLASHGDGSGPHFHHNGNCMEALSEWVLASGDATLAAFVNSCYQYGKSVGEPLTGFFPEYIYSYPTPRNVEDFEADGVYDMILTALNLSRAGFYDYWDDVDAYTRNMASESQLTSGWWIYDMVKNLGTTPVGSGETADNVPLRVVGAPAGWGGVNDFVKQGAGAMGGIQLNCCLGNSGRVWYHVWSNILNYDFNSNTLSINLLLNRFSEYADVASFLPYEGRVEITVNQALADLSVRMPGYVNIAQVGCSVNGQARSITWNGRSMRTGPVGTGDRVVATFPISERTEQVTIGGGPTILETYDLIIRGNTVVSITPPGAYYPYFKGQHYRTGPIRYRKVQRVLGKDIKW